MSKGRYRRAVNAREELPPTNQQSKNASFRARQGRRNGISGIADYYKKSLAGSTNRLQKERKRRRTVPRGIGFGKKNMSIPRALCKHSPSTERRIMS